MKSLLERLPTFADALIDVFSQASNIVRLPLFIGFNLHPLVIEAVSSRADLRGKLQRIFRSILYRQDVYTSAHSCRAASKFHDDQTKRRGGVASEIMGERFPQPVEEISESVVSRSLALEHFRNCSSSAYVYNIPSTLVHRLDSLQNAMKVDRPLDDAAPESSMYFRVVSARPSAMKQLPLAPGVGGKLTARDIAITVHNTGSVGAMVGGPDRLYCEPLQQAGQGSFNPIAIFQGFSDAKLINTDVHGAGKAAVSATD